MAIRVVAHSPYIMSGSRDVTSILQCLALVEVQPGLLEHVLGDAFRL